MDEIPLPLNGYSEKEALAAMKGLTDDCSVSDGIRQALKKLSKG